VADAWRAAGFCRGLFLRTAQLSDDAGDSRHVCRGGLTHRMSSQEVGTASPQNA
jgi:hypothetical protein